MLADLLIGQANWLFGRHDYIGAQRAAIRAYDAVVEGAREAGVDVDASEEQARTAVRSARQASTVHTPGEFIDTLGPHSPRSRP